VGSKQNLILGNHVNKFKIKKMQKWVPCRPSWYSPSLPSYIAFHTHIVYLEVEDVLAPNASSTKHFDILSSAYLNKTHKNMSNP
jgi:hypothetical protein